MLWVKWLGEWSQLRPHKKILMYIIFIRNINPWQKNNIGIWNSARVFAWVKSNSKYYWEMHSKNCIKLKKRRQRSFRVRLLPPVNRGKFDGSIEITDPRGLGQISKIHRSEDLHETKMVRNLVKQIWFSRFLGEELTGHIFILFSHLF